ncbi:hypothetical protein FCU45_04125 [Sulfurimonas crateris]|uniref:Uncharacterized protein n=1 Tax=Sulfurimonas crateris TaxID=2574727 RepID=A0A4U2Z8J2_9BACT|nr:hypothetical protein [Sulfurimonas crateris]TKI69810.1 hypothetical protein FCU45_04125 [Sulfurimonas crateris]
MLRKISYFFSLFVFLIMITGCAPMYIKMNRMGYNIEDSIEWHQRYNNCSECSKKYTEEQWIKIYQDYRNIFENTQPIARFSYNLFNENITPNNLIPYKNHILLKLISDEHKESNDMNTRILEVVRYTNNNQNYQVFKKLFDSSLKNGWRLDSVASILSENRIYIKYVIKEEKNIRTIIEKNHKSYYGTYDYMKIIIEKINISKKYSLTLTDTVTLESVFLNRKFSYDEVSKLKNKYNFSYDDFSKYYFQSAKLSKYLKEEGITVSELKKYAIADNADTMEVENFIINLKEIKKILNDNKITEWYSTFKDLNNYEIDSIYSLNQTFNILNYPDLIKVYLNLNFSPEKAKEYFFSTDINDVYKVDILIKAKIRKEIIKDGIAKKLSVEEIINIQKQQIAKEKQQIEKEKEVRNLYKKMCLNDPVEYNVITYISNNPYLLENKCLIVADALMTQVIGKNTGVYQLTLLNLPVQVYIGLVFEDIAPRFLKKATVKITNIGELIDGTKIPIAKVFYEFK